MSDYKVTPLRSLTLPSGASAPCGSLVGVSAARVLLLSEKDFLNRYRYVRL